MMDVLTKLLALFVGVKYGLIFLFSGTDAGALGVLFHWAWGIFMIMVAVGFWKYRGWAFLVVSVGLLASWLLALIKLILTADRGESVWGAIISWVLVMVVIAIFGRWNVERKFRPHLDIEH